MPGLVGYKRVLKYLPVRQNYNVFFEEFKARGIADNAFTTHFAPYLANPVVFSAYRLVRILAPDMNKIISVIKNSGMAKCVITYTPNNPAKLRVYPNLILDTNTYDRISNTCPCTNEDVLKTLVLKINADLKDPNLSKAWEDFYRARKRFKKFEDMDAGRALTRYTNIADSKGEERVKQLAEQIVDSRKPVKLMFAETPAEMLKMYSSGPNSCMSAEAAPRAWVWMVERKTHPTSFFAYHQLTRGCYIQDSKARVRARAILYKANGKEFYGRVYGSTDRDIEAMTNGLTSAGILPLPVGSDMEKNAKNGTGMFWEDAEFDIQGMQNPDDKKWYLPWPYFDNMRSAAIITFDDTTHVFHIKMNALPKSGEVIKGVFPSYNVQTAGFICSEHLSQVGCAYCGVNVNMQEAPGKYSQEGTGHRYCSNSCVERAQLCIAVDSSGTHRIMRQSEAIRDEFGSGYRGAMWYMNEGAAHACGARPIVDDHMSLNEGGEMSRSGEYVRDNNDVALFATPTTALARGWSDSLQRLKRFRTSVHEEKRIEVDFDTYPAMCIASGEIVDVSDMLPEQERIATKGAMVIMTVTEVTHNVDHQKGRKRAMAVPAGGYYFKEDAEAAGYIFDPHLGYHVDPNELANTDEELAAA